MEEAPTDGKQYVRQSAAWTSIVIPSTDWASISGKPATFPPTLPIPSSGVTGLDAAQTAQDTAILGKEPTITAGTTAQYRRGDKTWQTLDKAAVGLANVDNTSDANKPISTAVSAALNLKEDKANKGAANGYASLDATSKVPAAQLPSYVDDVLEYANFAAFPGTGAAGVIYVALDTNKTYRWSGTAYIEISASPGSTDAVPEGSTNLYSHQRTGCRRCSGAKRQHTDWCDHTDQGRCRSGERRQHRRSQQADINGHARLRSMARRISLYLGQPRSIGAETRRGRIFRRQNRRSFPEPQAIIGAVTRRGPRSTKRQ